MHLHKTFLLATLALTAAPVMAQHQFLPFGNRVTLASNSSVNTLNLGFNFTMPGGNVVTAVDADTHGRIIEVGTDPSDSSESTAEMTGNATGSINVLWDFTSYTADPNAGLFFYTDGVSVATISWINVQFIAPPATHQVQLFADGRIVMVYDSRQPADDGIIGVCPGNGAILPAQTDLSTSVGGSVVTTDPTVFEDFGFSAGVDAFDMPSTSLEFIPNGPGGASGWTVLGFGGVVDASPSFASIDDLGGECGTPSQAYLLTPDGAGSYNVDDAGGAAFDPNLGALAGATSDDTITAVNLDLGFPFTWPSGLVEQFVQVDPNGRILPDSASAFGDFSPSILDLTTDGYDMICPLWTDFNVTEPHSGDIFFNTDPGVSATFTWDGVAQFGTDNETALLTVQCTLFATGQILIVHESLAGFNKGGANDDCIVGVSTGLGGGTPVEIDYTLAAGGTTQNSPLPVHEFWDSSANVEPLDLVIATPNLVGLTVPLEGASFDFQVQDVPAGTTFGLYLIGFGLRATPVDTTPFGFPCTLAVDNINNTFVFADGLGNLNPLSIGIPSPPPSFIGLPIHVQGFCNGAPYTADFFLTNTIVGTIGDL